MTYQDTEDEYIINISDNGIGIEAPYREKIFGLFEKIDPHTAGCGIGLALARKIVSMHDGKLLVAGNADMPGTVFSIVLPRSRLETLR